MSDEACMRCIIIAVKSLGVLVLLGVAVVVVAQIRMAL